ncbi:MAG TPA: TIGR04255 family protein [Firmicutes bacterium]|nr:TIGR04255 family protein [Bacillota bacterium]
MSIKEFPFPDYKNPPVIEVVFGIQFKELNRLATPHVGKFWEILGIENFPEFREMPELPHIIEKEDSIQSPQYPESIRVEQIAPLPRLFFIDSDKDHIVQLQRDRFLVNWRKLSENHEYPRYAILLPKFQKTFEIFNEFIKTNNIGVIEPDQYELTYVNHITRDGAWKKIKDINLVFPGFSSTEGTFLPEPEKVSWRKIYRFPENRGRLYATMNQAVNKNTGQEMFVLNMTARGYDQENCMEWFNLAHEWIVRGFADLTGEMVQKEAWGKK